MNSLLSLRFEVWVDGNRDMFSIRAARPEGAPGPQWIWFVMFRDEFRRACKGQVSTLEDGYHKAIIHGDFWTFYDFEIPRDYCGEIKCPFVRVEIPRTFLKAVFRLCQKTWKMQRNAIENGTHPYDVPRVEIQPDAPHLANILRLYGQGKGSVEWFATEDTQALLDELKAKTQDFSDKLNIIENIAKNTTRGSHQHASVSISRDMDGRSFYWRACDPKGRTVMNGGLILHTSCNEWSIHT